MGKKQDRRFSANLLTLQLQLKTLLEDSGGDRVIALLDALAGLSSEEQKVVLAAFMSVVRRVQAGEVRVENDQDKELAQFENNLYRDILSTLTQRQTGAKLEVLNGGKTKTKSSPVVELSRYRTSEKPVVN